MLHLKDRTNRTNVLPLEHGITYIGKSIIKLEKKSVSLEGQPHLHVSIGLSIQKE